MRRRKLKSLCLCIALAISTVASSNGPASAADSAVVRLGDGRQFVGAIDSRTDGERLWLRLGRGSVRILRPIPWQAIAVLRRLEDGSRTGRPTSVTRDTPHETDSERAGHLLGFGETLPVDGFEVLPRRRSASGLPHAEALKHEH